MSPVNVRLLYAPTDRKWANDLLTEVNNLPNWHVTEFEASTVDFTVILNPATIANDTSLFALLHRLRRAGKPVVAWLSNDPAHFDRHYALAPLFDLVFTNDSNACLYYHAANVRWLAPGARLSINMPALTPGPSPNAGRGESRGSGLALESGTLTDNSDSPLYQNWERGAGGVRAGKSPNPSSSPYFSEPMKSLLKTLEAVEPGGRIMEKLAISYPEFPPGDGNRMFEIIPATPDAQTFTNAENAICQLVFLRQPELRTFFPPDAMPTFDNTTSLKEALDYLLTGENWRATGLRAQAIVREKHLWRHRWMTLWEEVQKCAS